MRAYLKSILAFVPLTLLGCMDSLHDYDECVEIETARCDLRDACKKAGDKEFEKNFSDFDKDTCIAYAKEHCRTREIKGDESEGEGAVAQDDIKKCTDAIKAMAPDRCDELDPGVDETEKWLETECWFIEEKEDTSEDEPDDDAGPDAA